MATNYTKRILFILCTTIIACQPAYTEKEKNELISKYFKERMDTTTVTSFEVEFVQMRRGSNKIIFKKYYIDPKSNIGRQRIEDSVWEDSTLDCTKITAFDHLFENVKDGGYCCCPYGHYSILFYNDKDELGVYWVDTSGIKDTAMFYDGIYQTSYLISLKTWNNFLRSK